MNIFLRTVEFLALGLWLGADVFLSFVVAPGAFHVLASRDQAGALVGFALTRMHWGGIICGAIFLLTRAARVRWFSALGSPAALCVVIMMAATLVSQFTVSPRMAILRTQMGSIETTSADSPLLSEFRRLHTMSISLESVVLLAGITAMFLMVRKFARLQ
jgi:uncharacterized membrane protein